VDAHARHIGRRVVLAVLLCSALPLAVLAYVAYALVIPNLDPADRDRSLAVQVLVGTAGLGILAGGYPLVVLGRALARAAASPGGVAGKSVTQLETLVREKEVEIARYQTWLEDAHRERDEAFREMESTSARLRETSFKDEVTGLYNRRFFSVRLEEELSRHRRFNHPVAVVLFDLDGFKAVNDEMGHAVGDETLRDVGQILMKHSRGINVVSRYGGDEFAILLVETSKAGARLYADRIRQVIASYPYSHGKKVTASFGIAGLPEDEALTSEDLVRLADEALYVAKRAGKNQVAMAPSRGGR
jgi:diguanylate cyclase (GGDEF)-like protein